MFNRTVNHLYFARDLFSL